MRRIIAILALCVLPSAANAASDESVRIYSNICWHEEAGDTLGVRIGIIKLTGGTYAFLQWSEGAPEDNPKMTEASASDLKHGNLVFSVLRNNELTTFRGTMTAKALIGSFSPKWPGDPKVFRLRRVAPQQRFPNCI